MNPKQILKKQLALLAKLYLARYSPKIVAITGSVGKSSTKEAIACVLKTRYRVRQSSGNYNNEIGLPLAILGQPSAGRNVLGWAWLYIKSLTNLGKDNYPEILVLEMGADRPGDIGYLADMVGNIDVAVITTIGVSHLQYFAHQSELAKEKLTLIRKLKSEGTAVLNFDSPKVFEGKNSTKGQVIGFGFDKSAHVYASDFQLIKSQGVWGANFKVHYKGTVLPFFLPKGLGKPAVYAALAAACVGLHFDINLVEVSESLKTYESPAGRLHLIEGIKRTMILDDTYNAAPDSTIAALDVLKQISTGRKVAALGSMTELGSETESGHQQVAKKIVDSGVELLFLVGEETRIIKEELEKMKFNCPVKWFANSDEARIPVQDAIAQGDMILIKGSQASRMEKIVKEIMAEPLKARQLLVRQDRKWL